MVFVRQYEHADKHTDNPADNQTIRQTIIRRNRLSYRHRVNQSIIHRLNQTDKRLDNLIDEQKTVQTMQTDNPTNIETKREALHSAS